MATETTFDKAEFERELGNFTGSDTFYEHTLSRGIGRSTVYTEGVKFVAEKCEAYWLIDKIALNEIKDPFQVWKLKVHENKSADLIVEDGNDNQISIEKLSYTDFPLDEFTIWKVDDTILLPSEY